MQKMKLSLFLAPLALLALIAPAPTPAQEAPKPEVKEEAKPVLLTEDEIKLWQAWIRGDLEACYSQAQSILELYDGLKASPKMALELQELAAEELGCTRTRPALPRRFAGS
jgi:hypothetical protein